MLHKKVKYQLKEHLLVFIPVFFFKVNVEVDKIYKLPDLGYYNDKDIFVFTGLPRLIKILKSPKI